jgi:hypothetical protein
VLLITIAAFVDARSTPQTGPAELYFSQTLPAFAATMFLGPSFMFGIGYHTGAMLKLYLYG